MIKNIMLLLTILFSHFTFASVISGEGRIVNVVDGDTFDVRVYRQSDIDSLLGSRYVDRKHVHGDVFRVRLANINTEESKHVDSKRNTSFGKQTSQIVKQNFSNEDVTFRCYDRGYYGRAVCSLNTGNNDIGYWLIANNYSPYVKKYGIHPEYHRDYLKASNKVTTRTHDSSQFATNDRHSHRNNGYHTNNQRYREAVNVIEQRVRESVNPILETAPETVRGNLLNKFKNRHNQQLQGAGSLNLFKNRIGNGN